LAGDQARAACQRSGQQIDWSLQMLLVTFGAVVQL